VRRRRGALELGDKEVETLLTGPASLEIGRLPGVDQDTRRIGTRPAHGKIGELGQYRCGAGQPWTLTPGARPTTSVGC